MPHSSTSGSRQRAAVAVAAALALILGAAPAHAELRYRVVLLRPSVTDDVTSDALARVRGELTAAGFEVSMLAQDPALDVRSALETVGRDLDPIAGFAIVRAPTGNTAEIWVCDRMAGKSVIQSVRLDSDGTPGEPSRSVVLAVQAVELLKASLAQYWLASVRRSAGATSATEGPGGSVAPPAAHVTAGVGVEAGVGWLDSAGAVTAVWQPLLRASYGGARGWAGRITVAGLGGDAEVHAAAGAAQIQQQLATLEIVRAFRAGGRVQPVLAAGGGAYRARIEGTGVPNPSAGITSNHWSALVSAGGGVVVPLVSHLALAVDAHLMLTWPYTAVRFRAVEAGNIGWPALLVSAGLLATF